MDTKEGTAKPLRRWFGAAGLIGAGLLAGGVLAGSLSAGAATSGTPAGSASTSANGNANANANGSAPRMDPAMVAHGPGETLLTGATASKVTAAAKAAVPGATIIRVETDSSGAAYEAHMKKADGSFVTVKLDSDFKVVGTVSGFGGGPGAPGGGA